MEKKEQRLNATIRIVADILEKNKDKEEIKELYNDIQKLKEKRNVN